MRGLGAESSLLTKGKKAGAPCTDLKEAGIEKILRSRGERVKGGDWGTDVGRRDWEGSLSLGAPKF